jgi:large subunit ribosomal protein L18
MTRHDSIKLRHKRIRKKVAGTPERPRLSVNFSGRHIRAQVIDDTKGVTLAAASTQEKAAKAGANVANAQSVGKLLADRAKKKSISKVVFDRGGFQYMGKVKALADAAREAGLEF